MSKKPLRNDKTCLNCNHVVAERFCPNCGQENIETRKTFHHLFIHFFEDLTHYENAFWKTLKNLLLKPASLTKEYLSGKRMSYLAPVRLYIFVSFITFFVISFLPSKEINDNQKNEKDGDVMQQENRKVGVVKLSFNEKTEVKLASPQSLKIKQLYEEGKLTKKEKDTLISYAEKSFEKQNENFYFGERKFKSLKELDSIQKFEKNESKKLNKLEYWIAVKFFKITHKNSKEEIKDKFLDSFQHNIPKALFIYMPIFAFLLWLFHNKKRWYYFDHGIFTLHFFSFLLTIVLLYNLLTYFTDLLNIELINDYFSNLLSLVMVVWVVIYFFKANKQFYNETRFISRLKSSVLFIINLIFITLVLSGLVIYSFINIH
jgi:hypothetical protein